MTDANDRLIGRIWRGRVPRDRLDEYLRYNRAEGLEEIGRQPGCVAVQQFSSDRGEIVEVTTISYWASLEAMQAFHGEGLGVSHLDRDAEFLLELPDQITLVDVHVNAWA